METPLLITRHALQRWRERFEPDGTEESLENAVREAEVAPWVRRGTLRKVEAAHLAFSLYLLNRAKGAVFVVNSGKVATCLQIEQVRRMIRERRSKGGLALATASDNLTPGFWDVDLRAYHEDRTCDSHTTLESFRESSSVYHQVYNLGTLPRREPTDALKLGSALHAWVLEPGRFQDLVAVEPAGTERRSNAGKAAWAAFVEQAGRKTIISQEQLELVKGMGQALRDSPIAGPLVFDAKGRNEQAIRWQDQSTGIWLKACFDRLLECGIELNLKTSRDPSPKSWAKDAYNLGYYRQLALYGAGRMAALNIAAEQLCVVVGIEPPHLVAVYELDDQALALGRRENQETLTRLVICRETGNWADAWETEITPISLPRWAFSER